MITSALRKLVEGENLSQDEAMAVMDRIMDGETTHAQIGALLATLRAKRETVDELTGFARAMRRHVIPVTPHRQPLLDTCGTGGDKCDTFNISTAAAFVIAAAGLAVAKHGNRAVSSKCGSADVLGALGVNLDLNAQQAADCIDQVGVGFLFAPHHHPAMKNVAVPRRELAIRTVFNVLGPLTNPAGATRQLIGVFAPDLCPLMAETLGRLGCEGAIVVHGMDGLDEISTFCPTRISILNHGKVTTQILTPSDFCCPTSTIDQLAGGASPEESADILRAILQGERGPRQDIVCANAAAGLILGGLAQDWQDGVSQARNMLQSGKANTVLERLINFTRNINDQTH